MAENYYFFDSTENDRRTYLSEDWARYFRKFLSSGLYHKDEEPGLTVNAVGNNMSVNVGSGSAFIEGRMYENTGTVTLVHDLPDSSTDRIDRIVIRLDLSTGERNIKAEVKKGVPSSNPEPPPLTRDSWQYELSLAQVRVEAGKSFIEQEQVTDERLDEDVCGVVYSLISVPTSQILDEWNLFFNGTKDDISQEEQQFYNDLNTKTQGFEDEFYDWFNDLQENGYASYTVVNDHINAESSSENVHGLRNNSLALGSLSEALDVGAIGLGYMAKSLGLYGIGIGQSTLSDGISSIAVGYIASAEGNNTIAMGRGASAEGTSATAMGRGASAENVSQGVFGGVGGTDTNNWIVPGEFTVNGTKNFEIPHPHPDKRETHRLRHAAVESPTAGDTLYRYEVEATEDGETVEMQLPDYFQYLNKDVNVWVNGVDHFGNAFAKVEGDTLKVTCQLAGKYKCLVIGTRNDDHDSVQTWGMKGVEREVGESWTGETYNFSVDEFLEVDEYMEVK